MQLIFPGAFNDDGELGFRLKFTDGTSGNFRARVDPVLIGDLNGDDVVDITDLLQLLAEWGPCPG